MLLGSSLASLVGENLVSLGGLRLQLAEQSTIGIR